MSCGVGMRRIGIAVLLGLAAGCAGPGREANSAKGPDSRAAEIAIRRAVGFLWDAQDADGGWHSRTYGLLRSGQSLTPFVLDALLQVPPDLVPLPAEKVDRALAFLRRHIGADGAVGCSDPMLQDYPNYATALAAQAFCSAHRPGWEPSAAALVACLRRQQFTEDGDWTPEDPAYGAWGMGGQPRLPPDPGQVDLSMTRHVLEALRAARAADDDPAFVKARAFLRRCQNFDPHDATADGGFFFSPVVLGANKAGHDGQRYRSYGSATADGILALLAAGASEDDPRVKAAVNWLVTHHPRDGSPPGFEGTRTGFAPEGLRFYYAAAAARVLRRFRVASTAGGDDWRAHLVEDWVRDQRPDGSWANATVFMKEDDPLIATALAVTALVGAAP